MDKFSTILVGVLVGLAALLGLAFVVASTSDAGAVNGVSARVNVNGV